MEWRFQGKFGFGGKFWRQPVGHKTGLRGEGVTIFNHYVDYYPEDHTKKLDQLKAEINTSLKKFTCENEAVRMALRVM